MTMPSPPSTRRIVRGFTLVELAVVVVLIGILAAFGVPMFLESVERSRAAEAFEFLSAVQVAQERYRGVEGTYADHISKLEFQEPELRYFTLTALGAIDCSTDGSGRDVWSLALTRIGNPDGNPSSRDQYTVVFTQKGFSAVSSTIPAANCPLSP